MGSRSTRGTGILPFLLRAVEGVAGCLDVRVGEIVMDKSAGFIFAVQLLPAQLVTVWEWA